MENRAGFGLDGSMDRAGMGLEEMLQEADRLMMRFYMERYVLDVQRMRYFQTTYCPACGAQDRDTWQGGRT